MRRKVWTQSRSDEQEGLGEFAFRRSVSRLFDARGEDFPNPGNNPVTIRADGKRGRHVRVTMLKGETLAAIDL